MTIRLTLIRMGWGWILAALPYGQAWKDGRRLFQKHVHPLNPELYQNKEREYLYKMLRLFLETPEDFLDHVRQ